MKNNVIKLIEDQHGNHVVQKCIERLPPEKVAFIVDELQTNVDKMAMHCYGCRVHLASQFSPTVASPQFVRPLFACHQTKQPGVVSVREFS